MRVVPLASGSKGNSYYVSSGGSSILIDAGLTAKELTRRLLLSGIDPLTINALFITHEHIDHIRGARVFSRQYRIPVFMNRGCLSAANERYELDDLPDIRLFETGLSFDFQDFMIHPLSISHDTVDPVCFAIEDGKNTLGIVTDLGKVTTLVHTRAMRFDAMVLESNHDLMLLKTNPRYPEHVKQRIRSNRGHLSNEQAASFARDVILRGKLRHLLLAHLSEQNNTEELSASTFLHAFSEDRIDLPFSFAKQYVPVCGIEL